MTAPYTTWTWRIGSTEPIEFQLTADGDPADLSAITQVEIRLKPADGSAVIAYNTVTHPARLAVTGAPTGLVTFYPLANELTLAQAACDVFFWVTDGASRIIPYPTGQNFVVRVIAAH